MLYQVDFQFLVSLLFRNTLIFSVARNLSFYCGCTLVKKNRNVTLRPSSGGSEFKIKGQAANNLSLGGFTEWIVYAPSTRIWVFFNPQLFLSGFKTFSVHT